MISYLILTYLVCAVAAYWYQRTLAVPTNRGKHLMAIALAVTLIFLPGLILARASMGRGIWNGWRLR